jgi:hypothetical protein
MKYKTDFICGFCSNYKSGKCEKTGDEVNRLWRGYQNCPMLLAVEMNVVFKCRGCGKETVWMKTRNGKSVLVNAESYDGRALFSPLYHDVHFKTCPNADKFRKKG